MFVRFVKGEINMDKKQNEELMDKIEGTEYTYHLVIDISNYTYEGGYELFEAIQNNFNLYDNCVIDGNGDKVVEQIIIESTDMKRLTTLGNIIKKNYKLGDSVVCILKVDKSETIVYHCGEETGGFPV
jgi:hypothetical protein